MNSHRNLFSMLSQNSLCVKTNSIGNGTLSIVLSRAIVFIVLSLIDILCELLVLVLYSASSSVHSSFLFCRLSSLY